MDPINVEYEYLQDDGKVQYRRGRIVQFIRATQVKVCAIVVDSDEGTFHMVDLEEMVHINE